MQRVLLLILVLLTPLTKTAAVQSSALVITTKSGVTIRFRPGTERWTLESQRTTGTAGIRWSQTCTSSQLPIQDVQALVPVRFSAPQRDRFCDVSGQIWVVSLVAQGRSEEGGLSAVFGINGLREDNGVREFVRFLDMESARRD